MEQLNYTIAKKTGAFLLKEAPERILQFGEGNFLRGFVDYFFDVLNEQTNFKSKIVVVQPIKDGLADIINEQQGLYNLYLHGIENGELVNKQRLISSISRGINPYTHYDDFLKNAYNPDLRFIVSNTTEAGIVFKDTDRFEDKPQTTFPAKLTRFLWERYKAFPKQEGFVILSCELIDNNGKELESCVIKYAKLWNLQEEFITWVSDKNIFCNTLVDRIITGRPSVSKAQELHKQNQYEDKLINTGEPYAFWAIEGPEILKKELPFEEANLPVVIVEDQSAFKKRKVRILNGAQTAISIPAYLSGFDFGREYMKDETFLQLLTKIIYDEIINSLDLPKEDILAFAKEVIYRLENPYIDHRLLAISLNSVAKWKARVEPSIVDFYIKYNKIPKALTFSLAALIAFYTSDELCQSKLIGKRGQEAYEILDDAEVLEFFAKNSLSLNEQKLVDLYLANGVFSGNRLKSIEGFNLAVAQYLKEIRSFGIKAVIKNLL